MAKRDNPKTETSKSGPSERPDGRRAVLLYMKPEITKRLKRVALDKDVTAYELAELVIDAYLRKAEKKSK